MKMTVCPHSNRHQERVPPPPPTQTHLRFGENLAKSRTRVREIREEAQRRHTDNNASRGMVGGTGAINVD